MNIKELKKVFRRTDIGTEKRVSMVERFVAELPEPEKENLAEDYGPSKQAIIQEGSVTQAGIKLSGRCYLIEKRIPFGLYYMLACAAADKPIKSPSRELADYRKEQAMEMGRTRKSIKPKRVGVLAERKSKRRYGKGRSDNDPGY